MNRFTDAELKYRAVQRYKAFRRVLRAKSPVPNFFGYVQTFNINGVNVQFWRRFYSYSAVVIDHGNSWGESRDSADAAFEHLKMKLNERIKDGLHAFVAEAYRRNIRGRNQLARLREKKRAGIIPRID